MKVNPIAKVGDRWDSATRPDVDSVTPIADGTGKIVAVFMSIATLEKWNRDGLAKGALTDLIAELKKIGVM